ncbi:MAG: hypothetical protein OXN25_14100 [Candidatus Poribacteria bacterium]|nr:hypothetical protein [Candidatus Poribacteria bacterium]
MTKYPNREALRKAHDIYRDAMRPFIVRCLNRIQGAKVEDLIRDSLDDWGEEQFERDLQRYNGNLESLIDIRNFPNIIGKYWYRDRGFSQQFDSNSKVRSKTETIVEGRNFWAHPGLEDVDPEHTRANLTYVAEVLGEIKNKEAKEAVEDIRDRLFSDEPEEHPTEVENADLKKRLAKMSDRLAVVETEKAELKRLEVEKAEYEELLDTVEKEKIEIEKQYGSAQTRLNELKAENVELKERLSETENRRKAIELESDKRIKTLTERQRTVVAEKTKLEERLKKLEKAEEENAKLKKDLETAAEEKIEWQEDLKSTSIWLSKTEEELEVCKGFIVDISREFVVLKAGKVEYRTSMLKEAMGFLDDQEHLMRRMEQIVEEAEEIERKNALIRPDEYPPSNINTPDSVTFYGTTFTKRLNTYHVAEANITQTFWHYWHAQGPEGKEEMRDAGWNVEKVNGDWEITISSEDFQAWIENKATELRNLFNASGNEELSPQPVQPVYKRTTLPTGKEMEQPALELLADRKEHRRVEIINCLTEYFLLTDDARSYLSKTGQAEKHLIKNGLITRTRTGYYRITPRGLQVLRQNP